MVLLSQKKKKERKLWTIDKWAEIRYFCCSPTRLHNEGFSAHWGVPKTALKWCLGTSYFFTFPSILAPVSRLVYYVVVLAGWPGPPLHLIKSRNSSVQRGKRSSSTEKTLLIKLSDTILHYLHTDTHIKCAKKWLRQRRYFLGWKGIGIYYLPFNAGSFHLLNIYWGVLLFLLLYWLVWDATIIVYLWLFVILRRLWSSITKVFMIIMFFNHQLNCCYRQMRFL